MILLHRSSPSIKLVTSSTRALAVEFLFVSELK